MKWTGCSGRLANASEKSLRMTSSGRILGVEGADCRPFTTVASWACVISMEPASEATLTWPTLPLGSGKRTTVVCLAHPLTQTMRTKRRKMNLELQYWVRVIECPILRRGVLVYFYQKFCSTNAKGGIWSFNFHLIWC